MCVCVCVCARVRACVCVYLSIYLIIYLSIYIIRHIGTRLSFCIPTEASATTPAAQLVGREILWPKGFGDSLHSNAAKEPVQVSNDSSAAFFSIFALHAKRPQKRNLSPSRMLTLCLTDCLTILGLRKLIKHPSTSHSSADAAPLSGEDTTPSPVQIPAACPRLVGSNLN